MHGLRSAFIWKQNAYKNFVGMPVWEVSGYSIKYNNKMDPTLIECEGVDSISFPERKEKLCVFVDKVMKLWSNNS